MGFGEGGDMVQLQNILCPVDFFKTSTRALDYAIKLASNYDARLHILHVVPPLIPTSYEYPIETKDLLRGLEDQAAKQMKVLARTALEAGVKADAMIRTGEIADELQWAAGAWSADLVVMGTHGRRGFQRWILGSVTERLLRHLHVPILIISEPSVTKMAPPSIKRVLVTTDFSEGTADALKYAFSLAQESQASVTLLHVLHDLAVDIPDHYRILLLEGVGERLRKLIPAEVLNWCEARAKVESGIPFQRILETAQTESADLVVMNIHGKGMLDRALIGSTAERVIRSAPCPVLAVPPMK